jgi:hypothetical protein
MVASCFQNWNQIVKLKCEDFYNRIEFLEGNQSYQIIPLKLNLYFTIKVVKYI